MVAPGLAISYLKKIFLDFRIDLFLKLITRKQMADSK